MEQNTGVPTEQTPVQAPAPEETEATSVPTTPVVEGEEVTMTSTPEDEMPSEPDKQREAFIKMRQEIKELREAQQASQPTAEEETAVLNEFRQTAQAPATFTPDMGTEEALNQMQQVALQSQAAQQRILELEQSIEDERLYSAFPELNPNNPEFKKPENRAFEKHVAGMYLLEKLKGNKPNLVSIARKAKEDFTLLSKPQQAIVQKEIEANLSKVEQATLEAKGNQENIQVSQGPDEVLLHGARKGNVDAIAALLKARG